MNNKYAVVITYSFDTEAVIHLFNTYEDAIDYLEKDYKRESHIDIEENEWISECIISADKTYAKITNHFYDHDDITEWRIGSVE